MAVISPSVARKIEEEKAHLSQMTNAGCFAGDDEVSMQWKLNQ